MLVCGTGVPRCQEREDSLLTHGEVGTDAAPLLVVPDELPSASGRDVAGLAAGGVGAGRRGGVDGGLLVGGPLRRSGHGRTLLSICSELYSGRLHSTPAAITLQARPALVRAHGLPYSRHKYYGKEKHIHIGKR